MKFIKLLIATLAIISSTNAAPVKDRCGPKIGKCAEGKCCSKYGWCGKSADHCSIAKGCQSEFGACTAPKKTNSVKTNVNNKAIKNSKSNKVSKSSKVNKSSKSNNNSNKTSTNSKTNKASNKTSTNSKTSKASNKTSTNSKTSKKSSVTKSSKKSNVKWAGFRYSPYGVKESFSRMPSVNNWDRYIKKIKGNFYGDTKGAIILIVGVVSKNKYCDFGFPKPKYVPSCLHVKFSKTDQYEEFLKKCDKEGYKVWLQVEAGDNDLIKLANIVLDRYGHHPSVNGFGVDLEWWYRNHTKERHGRPLTDYKAKNVVAAVRKRNPKYTVFAKHWKTSFMPPKYRDGMIFVNDSQGFHGSLDRMKKEFKEWAIAYKNSPVIFQIGYKADRSIWKKDPIKVAKTIANTVSQYNSKVGIVWVDFTMKEALEKM